MRKNDYRVQAEVEIQGCRVWRTISESYKSRDAAKAQARFQSVTLEKTVRVVQVLGGRYRTINF